jgi:hypothetical protein
MYLARKGYIPYTLAPLSLFVARPASASHKLQPRPPFAHVLSTGRANTPRPPRPSLNDRPRLRNGDKPEDPVCSLSSDIVIVSSHAVQPTPSNVIGLAGNKCLRLEPKTGRHLRASDTKFHRRRIECCRRFSAHRNRPKLTCSWSAHAPTACALQSANGEVFQTHGRAAELSRPSSR